jgi:hypothetical protein
VWCYVQNKARNKHQFLFNLRYFEHEYRLVRKFHLPKQLLINVCSVLEINLIQWWIILTWLKMSSKTYVNLMELSTSFREKRITWSRNLLILSILYICDTCFNIKHFYLNKIDNLHFIPPNKTACWNGFKSEFRALYIYYIHLFTTKEIILRIRANLCLFLNHATYQCQGQVSVK